MGLLIGTSGWSYPSGNGTWNGLFYPATSGKGRGRCDDLRYYAERFDTVEVNSTFYAPPRVEVTRSWVERTPPGFEFSLKLFQKFTHPGMFREAAQRRAPGTASPLLDLLAEVTERDIDGFRKALDPLADSGRLGALLAQFPPSFTDSPPAREYLAWLLRAFSGYCVAVELRHRSWSDAIRPTIQLLNAFDAAWVQIDEPKFRLSIRQNFLPNVSGSYYMRLHGRNAAQWWRHARSEDRYDYLYSADELRQLGETAAAAAALVRKSYLYTNNHFAAKSVVNALMLKAQLGQPARGDVPPALIARYPEIQALVTAAVPARPSRLLS